MAIIAEVRFVHENGALAETLATLPDLTVGTVREASTTPGRNVYVFRFDNVGRNEVRPVLEADRTVRRSTPISAVDDRQLWGIEFATGTKLLGPEVTAEGGLVVDARSLPTRQRPRGWRERWFFPEHSGIHNVWAEARSEGFEFEVLDFQRLRSDTALVQADPLTRQQRTALVTAYERGYFEEPRETSLEELADSLEVSPSAVQGRLKRGLKALIESMFVVDEPERNDPSGGEPDRTEYRTELSTRPIER